MRGQIEIFEIETRTKVPLKFRFPYFVRMQWYAAHKYLNLLRNNTILGSSFLILASMKWMD
jgi:hypothetical protein